MPVMTADTAMYNTVQMPSDARMPIGTSRCGLIASSECVEIESKPMKAKKPRGRAEHDAGDAVGHEVVARAVVDLFQRLVDADLTDHAPFLGCSYWGFVAFGGQ